MDRRLALVIIAVLSAGCAEGFSQNTVQPADHLSDWHEEPVRGSAEPITVETNSTDETDCLSRATDALETRLNKRIDDLTAISHGFGNNGIRQIKEAHLFVSRDLYVTDGEVTLKPNISFSTLKETVPRTISVESAGERTDQNCQWPVYVYDIMVYK